MKRKNKVISMILAFVFALGCAPLCSAQGEAVPELSEYGFVDCGDVKIEYGVCGKLDGEPLLLLPPNGRRTSASSASQRRKYAQL